MTFLLVGFGGIFSIMTKVEMANFYCECEIFCDFDFCHSRKNGASGRFISKFVLVESEESYSE